MALFCRLKQPDQACVLHFNLQPKIFVNVPVSDQTVMTTTLRAQ